MKTVNDIIKEYNGAAKEPIAVNYLTLAAMLKDAQVDALRKAVEVVRGYEHLHVVVSSLEHLIEEIKAGESK